MIIVRTSLLSKSMEYIFAAAMPPMPLMMTSFLWEVLELSDRGLGDAMQ